MMKFQYGQSSAKIYNLISLIYRLRQSKMVVGMDGENKKDFDIQVS